MTNVVAIGGRHGASPQTKERVGNRPVDTLEQQRKWLSPAAFGMGRRIEATFERASRTIGTAWADDQRIDYKRVSCDPQLRTSRAAVRLEDLVRKIGPRDAELLRDVLIERKTLCEVAEDWGEPPGDKGRLYIGRRFRQALEDLVDKKFGRGPEKIAA